EDILARRLRTLSVGAVASVLVHSPAVAPQPLRDVLGRVIECRIGVPRLAFAAQDQATSGIHVDVAGEEAAGTAERGTRRQRMTELLVGDDIKMVGLPGTQRIGRVDLLAGNRDLHHVSPQRRKGRRCSTFPFPEIRPAPPSPAYAAPNWEFAAPRGIW